VVKRKGKKGGKFGTIIFAHCDCYPMIGGDGGGTKQGFSATGEGRRMAFLWRERQKRAANGGYLSISEPQLEDQ
jgi:hypothetical protein